MHPFVSIVFPPFRYADFIVSEKGEECHTLFDEVALGMYVLSAFGGMLGNDKLEVITPLKHFEPNYILRYTAYDLPLVLIRL